MSSLSAITNSCWHFDDVCGIIWYLKWGRCVGVNVYLINFKYSRILIKTCLSITEVEKLKTEYLTTDHNFKDFITYCEYMSKHDVEKMQLEEIK